jgi:hypothetical protein
VPSGLPLPTRMPTVPAEIVLELLIPPVNIDMTTAPVKEGLPPTATPRAPAETVPELVIPPERHQ